MTCPVNGQRVLSEFIYGGELRPMPEPEALSDEAWADYVFNVSGVGGIKHEWWCHTPSGVWFIAERDTQTGQVVRTYLYPDSAGDAGLSSIASSSAVAGES